MGRGHRFGKFFDNVNHDKMISLIMKDVKCGEIVSLINKFLKVES